MKKLVVLALTISTFIFAGRAVSAQQFSFSNLPTRTQQNTYSLLIERINQSKVTLGSRINTLQELSDSLSRKLYVTQTELGVDLSGPIGKVENAKRRLQKAEDDLNSINLTSNDFSSVDNIKLTVSEFRDTLKRVILVINSSKVELKQAVIEAKLIIDSSN